MNGQTSHTSVNVIAQNALPPISQYVPPLARCRAASRWSTAPVWSWKASWASSAITNPGMTYGTRYSERSTARPRNRWCTLSAAKNAIGVEMIVDNRENLTLIHTEVRAETPVTVGLVSPVAKLPKAANGALAQCA